MISKHVSNYGSGGSYAPLFLYYSLQNVHVGAGDELEAPLYYLNKCQYLNSLSDVEGEKNFNATKYSQNQAYCALVIMFDEAIGNTTCSLVENGIDNNTVIVVASE